MLEIKGLKVSFHTYSGEVQAVRGVDLALEEGGIREYLGNYDAYAEKVSRDQAFKAA